MRRSIFCLLLVFTVGCNPALNWRDVPVGDDGLVAMLPCKPDRATRTLALGGSASATVQVAGCEADGATFAVAAVRALDAAQADTWLTAWRSATRSQLGAAPVSEAPAIVARAAATPAPVQLDAPAAAARTIPARMLWFAQQRGTAVVLYQATMLGTSSSADAWTTFTDGLRLP